MLLLLDIKLHFQIQYQKHQLLNQNLKLNWNTKLKLIPTCSLDILITIQWIMMSEDKPSNHSILLMIQVQFNWTNSHTSMMLAGEHHTIPTSNTSGTQATEEFTPISKRDLILHKNLTQVKLWSKPHSQMSAPETSETHMNSMDGIQVTENTTHMRVNSTTPKFRTHLLLNFQMLEQETSVTLTLPTLGTQAIEDTMISRANLITIKCNPLQNIEFSKAHMFI